MDREGDDGIIIFTNFAVRVKVCGYEHKRKFGVQNVLEALGTTSKSIEMRGLVNPIYREPGKYIFPLK